jgi:hypothetical protein
MNKNTMYNVKNRSASMVVYKIPEANIRREWQPGEVKRISFKELEQLSYQSGGKELMGNFLQIIEEEVTDNLGINRQPEYDMSEDQIVDLILNGTYEAFLDALDFAPIGDIDLLKKFAVSLPITDMQKRQALKEKTGFDVDKAIENEKADKATEAPKGEEGKVNNATAATAPGRRVTTSYKVVEKK